VLSIFWPNWIEALTGYDPDQHDGTGEWLIVIALLSTHAVLALPGARAEWRQARRRLSVARPAGDCDPEQGMGVDPGPHQFDDFCPWHVADDERFDLTS
jgi:hypothetical protein